MKNAMTIREIESEFQISRRMIQEYESKGLIRFSNKNHYGHLLYETQMVKKIVVIRYFQKLGVTLAEIKCLFEAIPTKREEFVSTWLLKSEENVRGISTLNKYGPYIINAIQEQDYIEKIYGTICDLNPKEDKNEHQ